MHTKRNHEGYLMIDSRNNPGVPDEIAISVGLPAGAGRGLFEAPTITCSHCHRIVVLNPSRTRERAWCKHCDHYLCDGCGVVLAQTHACKTMNQIIDEVQKAASSAPIIY